MQKGSVVMVLVIIVLILSGILVFVAWLPYPQTSSKTAPLPVPTQTPIAQNTPEASPAFENTNDLDSATKSLDSTDLDQMDSELNKFNSEASF